MLKTITLVNSTWLTLIARITSRDAHLDSRRSASAFLLRLLPPHSSTQEPRGPFSMEINRVANQSCRSLTFHIDGRISSPFPADEAPGMEVGSALKLASDPHYLPNLQHISISYTDASHNQIFQHLRLGGFPPQTTRLSLDYSWTAPSEVPRFNFDVALVWIHKPSLGPRRGFIKNLRHLALSGVPRVFAVVMLAHVCPYVETLELTHPGQLYDPAPLPPGGVRTLILRYPGVALSKRDMASWMLPAALSSDRRLFTIGADLKPPRIIVRSCTPDPVAFIELRRVCKRFDVDLVYERDDSRSPILLESDHDTAFTDFSPQVLAYLRQVIVMH